MHAGTCRPLKEQARGEDCILVATHPSGLEFGSIVALKSALVPFRKHPALRGSCKKGGNAFSIFLSDSMNARNAAHATFVLKQLLSPLTAIILFLNFICEKNVAQMGKEQKAHVAQIGGFHGSPYESNRQGVGTTCGNCDPTLGRWQRRNLFLPAFFFSAHESDNIDSWNVALLALDLDVSFADNTSQSIHVKHFFFNSPLYA
jgi:hypothetical protein